MTYLSTTSIFYRNHVMYQYKKNNNKTYTLPEAYKIKGTFQEPLTEEAPNETPSTMLSPKKNETKKDFFQFVENYTLVEQTDYYLSRMSNGLTTKNAMNLKLIAYSIGRKGKNWIYPGSTVNFTFTLKKSKCFRKIKISAPDNSCSPNSISVYFDSNMVVPDTPFDRDAGVYDYELPKHAYTQDLIISAKSYPGKDNVCLSNLTLSQ